MTHTAGRRHVLRWLAAITVCALALVVGPSRARAQAGIGGPGLGGPGMGGMGSGFGGTSQQTKKPKGPEGPETHAASGADDAGKLQTQEPTLPDEPTKISPTVKKHIGTDAEREADEQRGPKTEREIYPFYYSEKSGSYRFRTIFPLWAQRDLPHDRATLVAPFFFQRRSEQIDQDILFPLFWRLRSGNTRTTILGPWMHRESPGTPERPGVPAVPGRHDNWLAPLYFEGKSDDGSGYFHVPPLLTYTTHTSHSGLNIVGPAFCTWKGGATCDARTADQIDLGVAPLYFYGHDERSEYEVIPPLLHYYKYSDAGDSSFNVWGPFIWDHSRESDAFNIVPFYWHNWGKNEDHTTVFPLFHYGYKGASKLLITPLFVASTGDHGESTFATYLFARYRGRTELDMWTPLYWQYRDPDIGLDRKLLFPLFYRNTSPRQSDIVVFPFFAHFEKPAIRETTFVTPFFRHTTDLTGWETDIFPLFYFGRDNSSTHLVAAPLLFDFNSPQSHTTVVLPAYFRVADQNSISQLALNTYYHERKVQGGREWEIHVFPFFSYGESPTGHWWNVLYGLAGYTREGTKSKLRAAYIPIDLSE